MKTDEGGDWTALYKDGKKVEENHSIDLRRGLEALGIDFSHAEVPEDEARWGDDPFPETIDV